MCTMKVDRCRFDAVDSTSTIHRNHQETRQLLDLDEAHFYVIHDRHIVVSYTCSTISILIKIYRFLSLQGKPHFKCLS